jgi:hypothetical protein
MTHLPPSASSPGCAGRVARVFVLSRAEAANLS